MSLPKLNPRLLVGTELFHTQPGPADLPAISLLQLLSPRLRRASFGTCTRSPPPRGLTKGPGYSLESAGEAWAAAGPVTSEPLGWRRASASLSSAAVPVWDQGWEPVLCRRSQAPPH